MLFNKLWINRMNRFSTGTPKCRPLGNHFKQLMRDDVFGTQAIIIDFIICRSVHNIDGEHKPFFWRKTQKAIKGISCGGFIFALETII